jgi:hypothetical protein
MAVTHKDTHISEAAALLISEFKKITSITTLLATFIQQVQLAEDAAFAVLNSRTVASASGAQLDLLGGLVGQPREGRDDDTYRLYITVRIAINRGSGTPGELLNIFTLLAAHPTLIETFPASFALYTSEIDDALAAAYAALLQLAKPAGVKAAFIYTVTDDAHTFTFSDDDTEQASTLQGWADDAQTTGGQLSEVI